MKKLALIVVMLCLIGCVATDVTKEPIADEWIYEEGQITLQFVGNHAHFIDKDEKVLGIFPCYDKGRGKTWEAKEKVSSTYWVVRIYFSKVGETLHIQDKKKEVSGVYRVYDPLSDVLPIDIIPLDEDTSPIQQPK